MSYICDGCIDHWKDGKFMKACGICAGHQKAGWTTDQLLDVYYPMLKAREAFKVSTNIFPPSNERQLLSRSSFRGYMSYKTYLLSRAYFCGRGLNEQQMIDLHKMGLWPIPCSQEQKEAFCDQEKTNLLRSYTSLRAWDLLDPITQRVIIFFGK